MATLCHLLGLNDLKREDSKGKGRCSFFVNAKKHDDHLKMSSKPWLLKCKVAPFLKPHHPSYTKTV